MSQLQLPLLGRLDQASVVPPRYLNGLTYRQAVRLCWQLKRVKNATRQMLAAECDLYASHVSDYLHEDDGKNRRDLPASAIPAFEAFCGNTAVSQWVAQAAKLTVVEELQAMKVAA
jgi:hypothetical protein